MTPENKTKLKEWKHEQLFPKRQPLTPEQEAERRRMILQYKRHIMTPVQHITFCKKCNHNEWGTTDYDKIGCFLCLKCGTCNSIFHPCHCEAELDENKYCKQCGESYSQFEGLFDD